MTKPRLALTMGDAAGIGPELIVRCLREEALHDCALPLVVGHPEVLRRAAQLIGAGQAIVEIDTPEQADPSPRVIPCLRAGREDVLEVAPATVDARSGRAAFECLALATELALTGRIDGITTAPLNKEALHAAGFPFPGHTEALASLCACHDVAMMLYLAPGSRVHGPAGLGVVHVTLHVALADVPRNITKAAVLAKVRLLHEMMRRLLQSEAPTKPFPNRKTTLPPRLALAALNPHAGEGGVFGDEERRILAPAVQQAREEGIDLAGPIPADALFARAVAGEFDGVIAMYHDQGHVALKLLDFHGVVNVTLGLPVIRTSPTYGTAFDIAWKGTARPEGMIQAAKVAVQLVQNIGKPLGTQGALLSTGGAAR